jgi:hypothetical protein
MGTQSPPNMLCFIAVAVTFVISIIALALSGNLCGQWLFCLVGGNYSGAAGLGVTAGVFGLVFSMVASAWLLISELWDVGIMRFVLVAAFALTAVFAFIAGILFAIVTPTAPVAMSGAYGTSGAAAAFEFFLMICAAGSAFLCFQAGGGGTAA